MTVWRLDVFEDAAQDDDSCLTTRRSKSASLSGNPSFLVSVWGLSLMSAGDGSTFSPGPLSIRNAIRSGCMAFSMSVMLLSIDAFSSWSDLMLNMSFSGAPCLLWTLSRWFSVLILVFVGAFWTLRPSTGPKGFLTFAGFLGVPAAEFVKVVFGWTQGTVNRWQHSYLFCSPLLKIKFADCSSSALSCFTLTEPEKCSVEFARLTPCSLDKSHGLLKMYTLLVNISLPSLLMFVVTVLSGSMVVLLRNTGEIWIW